MNGVGWALKQMRGGSRVQRAGWNGKGMWLALQVPDEVAAILRRLAQELIAHVQKSGATLLRGGCYEYEATTPYLPFVEAFRDWAHRQSAGELRAALGSTAAEIAKFAPEIETNSDTDVVKNCTLAPGRTLDDVMHTFVSAIHAEQRRLAEEHAGSQNDAEVKSDQKTAQK